MHFCFLDKQPEADKGSIFCTATYMEVKLTKILSPHRFPGTKPANLSQFFFFLCVCSKATSTRSVDLAVNVSLCGPTVAQACVSPVCLPAGLPETRLSQATCALLAWCSGRSPQSAGLLLIDLISRWINQIHVDFFFAMRRVLSLFFFSFFFFYSTSISLPVIFSA